MSKSSLDSLVNSPAHYNQYPMEVIDMLRTYFTSEEYYGFLIGNMIKYLLRADHKGQKELDLEKAEWYRKKAEEFYKECPSSLIGPFNFDEFCKTIGNKIKCSVGTYKHRVNRRVDYHIEGVYQPPVVSKIDSGYDIVIKKDNGDTVVISISR